MHVIIRILGANTEKADSLIQSTVFIVNAIYHIELLKTAIIEGFPQVFQNEQCSVHKACVTDGEFIWSVGEFKAQAN